MSHIVKENIKTLVIKIGTSLLSGQRAFEGQVMEAMVKELCRLKSEHDINILIVTSGAVGCGMNTLEMSTRPTSLPAKQAVAAVGQATLMHYYETLFLLYGEKQNLHTAQVLLNAADLDNRQSYLNVRNTLNTLFNMRCIIPIINENDSTATEQLRFGDNDTLAAKIAAKNNADLLIILSDVDGLYDKNPQEFPDAKLITEVHDITSELLTNAGGAGTICSTGGMRTKLEAVKIAFAAGVPVVIANGHRKNIINDVLNNKAPKTIFTSSRQVLSHRKRWIAFGRTIHGTLIVDDGAKNALCNLGTSLLSAGVTDVRGNFEAGDAVEISDSKGIPVARALVNYNSLDLRRIKGRRSQEIESILGHKDYDVVVHRNNLVLL